MARLKGREPKNPREADSGDGCGEAMMGVCPSIGVSDCAGRPHRIATSGPPRSTRASIARCVTFSQPQPLCEAGAPGRTVSTRLSSMTPCRHHGVRSPDVGLGTPRSLTSSRKMFSRLRGGLTPGATEKLSPMGWPGVG